MLRFKFVIVNCRKLHKRSFSKSCIRLEQQKESPNNIHKIRNIGILAHIDAGKTTTTERMLYYSGEINNMGEVHHGNTVTDYMEQERLRGITITSAAVTFNWKNYRFNLIDTPGHIDFTMGVEQTLGVLDGAVVILDGSAGVEAQTLTVWRQADKYKIPRVIYVNKMDRADADFEMSLSSVETKLETETLPIQFPVKIDNQLAGIVDVITLEKWSFNKKDQGRIFQKFKLEDEQLLTLAKEKRKSLTDKLSGLDDELANHVIEQNSLDDVSSQLLLDSLRRVTIARKAVPVLLGSSYKNIGVQPLMDAVVRFLPYPEQTFLNASYSCFKDNLVAKVFKIVHNKQRGGAFAFVRIYNGSLKKGQKLYNGLRDVTEQCNRLFIVNADEYEEIMEVGKGNIGAILGLKNTITGDLITSSSSAFKDARKFMLKKTKKSEEEVDRFLKAGAYIPDAVFFCSIEPPSLAYQTDLDNALMELEKEDPSLRVKLEPETGQTVLAGMGELHMEIIKDRIKSEYKIDVDLGELQIAYKETIQQTKKDEYNMQFEISGSTHKIKVILTVLSKQEGATAEKPLLILDNSPECMANLKSIHPKVIKAIENGIVSAFSNGPKLGCPVINVGVKLHWLEVGRHTSTTVVSAAITQCIKKLMKECESIILEPIMDLEVVVIENHSISVVSDLDRRRAEIQEIYIRGQNKIVRAFVPLSELLGYATNLRISTSGNATFTMEFSHYNTMDPYNERQAIKRITGF